MFFTEEVLADVAARNPTEEEREKKKKCIYSSSKLVLLLHIRANEIFNITMREQPLAYLRMKRKEPEFFTEMKLYAETADAFGAVAVGAAARAFAAHRT